MNAPPTKTAVSCYYWVCLVLTSLPDLTASISSIKPSQPFPTQSAGGAAPGAASGGGDRQHFMPSYTTSAAGSSTTTSEAAVNPMGMASKVCAKGDAICIPSNYSKFDLPNETQTVVNVGIDIKG